MADLHVEVVTPVRQVYSGPATEVRVPGWEGQFGVLPGHDLFLSLLRAGTLVIVTASGEQRFVVGRGFAEAGPDRVTILTDSCEDPGEVDKAAAQAELEDAARALSETGGEEAGLRAVEARAELARARLDA